MDEKIGFIGLGAMGGPMSKNLLKRGYKLTIYDVASARVEPIAKEGARVAASCKEVAEQSDVIITMVPSSPNAREAILGEKGVIRGVRWGSIVIDMSTIDPVTTREISRILLERGVSMLDAPVARGVQAAKTGTLMIFVGGEKETFDKCKDILSAMGSDIEYIGLSGAGEVVKIINNLITSTTMCLLSEALVLGVKAGVDAGTLYKALSTSSASSFVLQNHVKNFALKGKFEKGVFPVDYMIKDLNLVMTTSAQYHVPQYLGSVALQTYEAAHAAGYGERYIPVVIKLLEELTGVEVRAEIDEE